jgi:hypothetical protein
MLQKSLISFGNEVLTGTAVNDTDNKVSYSNKPAGAVRSLKDGIFATPPPEQAKTNLTTGIMKAYYATAISAMWLQQEVFIAKLSSGLFDNWDGTTVCDLYREHPKYLTSKDTSSFCDGNTRYIFMR